MTTWLAKNMYHISVPKIRKNIYRSDVHVTFSLTVVSDVYRCLISNKTTFIKYCLNQWISKLLSKSITGKFLMCGRHSKCNCLQDQANFHRSQASQIVLILVTLHLSTSFMVITTMTTSSNGNIFRVTGHLCGEFTGLRWIPRTKVSDAELLCFLWSVPE